MAIQWHPLFAQLLRPLVEGFYDVEINVPVGDAPRQADVVLLRRLTANAPPFRGLWRHLTTWNVLEYKGPTVSARFEHLDLLIELGLGIRCRLNEERSKAKQKPVIASEVSFWYLAYNLGRRFRRKVHDKLGGMEAHGDGVWRGRILDYSVFLVNSSELPVEIDTVPLHLLGLDPEHKGLSAARLVAREPALLELFGPVLGSLHPETLKELQAMAKSSKKGPQFHLKPLVDLIGMKAVINELGLKEIIAEVGPKKVIDEMGPKKVIDEMGVKKVIDEMGVKKVIDEVGVTQAIDELLTRMSPAERRALKSRLEEK